MRRAWAIPILLFSACSAREEISLHYTLDQIDPAQVVRVETVISVDPSDPREWFADQPFRSVATGVGYEVRDVDQSGKREVQITHDATLGYVFDKTFTFTLLPQVGGSPPPLSLLARAVGATDTIGETAPLATRFGPGTVLDVKLTDQRCNGVACTANEECCAQSCARTDTDPTNCGGCGKKCAAGESCSGELCRCAGGSACTGTTICCTNGCIDTATDAFNCGGCGQACNPGETCAGGHCTCGGGAACGTGGVCCAGGVCSATGSCACGVAGSMCSAPKTCCDATLGTCVNLENDDAHCGDCNKACSSPLHCVSGACACNGVQCSSGDTCCTSGCASLMTDPVNCGGCDRRCAPGETCAMGACVCGGTPCQSGQTCCSSMASTSQMCVDTSSDSHNCGFCGNRCNIGEQCSGGNCSCAGGPSCVGNQTCCQDGCFDLSADPGHCGACNMPCPNGSACMMGRCVTTSCDPSCAVNGNQCVNGQCLCNNGPACTGQGIMCCAGGCKNLLTDTTNCGACQKVCSGNGGPAGPSGAGGTGGTTGTSDLCCNGTCTPQANGNCGACGVICNKLTQCCGCGGTLSCQVVCPLCPTGGPTP
jgi:hypothetical protein